MLSYTSCMYEFFYVLLQHPVIPVGKNAGMTCKFAAHAWWKTLFEAIFELIYLQLRRRLSLGSSPFGVTSRYPNWTPGSLLLEKQTCTYFPRQTWPGASKGTNCPTNLLRRRVRMAWKPSYTCEENTVAQHPTYRYVMPSLPA